ncbi:adenylate synthase [bacterium]|nr:adenylate synthase [bacterium]
MKFKLLILKYFIVFRLRRFFLRNKTLLSWFQGIKFRSQQKKWKNSEFYADLNHRAAKLNEYPVLYKAVFMKNFEAINTAGIALEEAFKVALDAENGMRINSEINGITVGLSSGTSGNRGVFLASEKERAQWVGAVLDRVIGLKLKKRKVAFFLRANSELYESVNSSLLQFDFYNIHDELEVQVERLNALNPDILVAQPSVLLRIAEGVNMGKCKIKPSKIISVAEVLEPIDERFLERVFDLDIDQVYQCTEGFLAFTCNKGNLHLNEYSLIIEKRYIDLEKKRFHPIITDLERVSQPIIRYELNDILIEGECTCGSVFTCLEQIEGRADDTLCFENQEGRKVYIYPDIFRRRIIKNCEWVHEYQLVQTGERELEYAIKAENGSSLISEQFKKEIAQLLEERGLVDIELEEVKYLDPKPGDKLRRIRNTNYEKA